MCIICTFRPNICTELTTDITAELTTQLADLSEIISLPPYRDPHWRFFTDKPDRHVEFVGENSIERHSSDRQVTDYKFSHRCWWVDDAVNLAMRVTFWLRGRALIQSPANSVVLCGFGLYKCPKLSECVNQNAEPFRMASSESVELFGRLVVSRSS